MSDPATTMRAARAVFLDTASLGADLDLAPLAAASDVFRAHPASRAEEVVARLAHANVAICNKAPIDEAAFAALPALELVATDRDRHIARQHPEVVHWAALMLTISRYRHLDCHD